MGSSLQSNANKTNRYPKGLSILAIINGYFKYIEKLLQLKIPNEMQKIIKNYLQSFCMYGIGKSFDEHGQFSSGDNTMVNKWESLHKIENLIKSPNNIYCNGYSILLITSNGLLYQCGLNQCII